MLVAFSTGHCFNLAITSNGNGLVILSRGWNQLTVKQKGRSALGYKSSRGFVFKFRHTDLAWESRIQYKLLCRFIWKKGRHTPTFSLSLTHTPCAGTKTQDKPNQWSYYYNNQILIKANNMSNCPTRCVCACLYIWVYSCERVWEREDIHLHWATGPWLLSEFCRRLPSSSGLPPAVEKCTRRSLWSPHGAWEKKGGGAVRMVREDSDLRCKLHTP